MSKSLLQPCRHTRSWPTPHKSDRNAKHPTTESESVKPKHPRTHPGLTSTCGCLSAPPPHQRQPAQRQQAHRGGFGDCLDPAVQFRPTRLVVDAPVPLDHEVDDISGRKSGACLGGVGRLDRSPQGASRPQAETKPQRQTDQDGSRRPRKKMFFSQSVAVSVGGSAPKPPRFIALRPNGTGRHSTVGPGRVGSGVRCAPHLGRAADWAGQHRRGRAFRSMPFGPKAQNLGVWGRAPAPSNCGN